MVELHNMLIDIHTYIHLYIFIHQNKSGLYIYVLVHITYAVRVCRGLGIARVGRAHLVHFLVPCLCRSTPFTI